MSELHGEYVIEEQSPSDFLLFIGLRKKWGQSSEGITDSWKEREFIAVTWYSELGKEKTSANETE